jgi:deoxyhypusine synthase
MRLDKMSGSNQALQNESAQEPIAIKGIDFEQSNSLDAIAQSLLSTGFQASHLGRAIALLNTMITAGAPVFLSFTGNIVSSGLREILAFLTKHRYVNAIVTTASGVEEDVIKSFGSFALDRFDADGDDLLDRREYRIGNIVVPQSLYRSFERFLRPVLDHALRSQRDGLPPVTPSQLIAAMGGALGDQASFLHWAARNDVPVYCPGITDGAIGDNLVVYANQHPALCIDVVRDHRLLVEQIDRQQRPIVAIVIGGGISKHYLLNASVFRGGFDAVVRISTAIEYDGSDSGGNRDESISWMKLQREGNYVSVFGEATLVFPLLIGASFASHFHAGHRATEGVRV